jgi:hypothetical protein
LKVLYAFLLPSEHTQHTENHKTEFHESCCVVFYRTIAKQFQFMLITHSSGPLHMKIYTSFCAHEHLHP